ncbi:uncharacterized protein LOC120075312 [Benincasa hispida]|uniref:uncharacterized protein LOC120075312 n=1 Tax=Benincasa hispida TaxID=102211 RepID=UPI0019016184|nr:uncharacterized protein LOC120075312 [Benincasa hispida]
MIPTSLPSYLWGDTVLTATHLINRMPSRVLKFQKPLEYFKESFSSTRLFPDVPLRVFGCTVFVHNHGPHQSKFAPQAKKCVFVGYPLHQRGYKCFQPSSRKYFITMDSTFQEDKQFFPVSPLQGKTTSEEANASAYSVPLDLFPEPILETNDSVLTKQVFWITYYRKNLRKEIVPKIAPSVAPPEGVQESKPEPAQGTSILDDNEYVEGDVVNSGKVRIDGGGEFSGDTQGTENVQQLGTDKQVDKTSEIDATLDLLITLRKGTRSYTKHSMKNFLSYSNLSTRFKAFTTSLDTVMIPGNVHKALEVPE